MKIRNVSKLCLALCIAGCGDETSPYSVKDIPKNGPVCHVFPSSDVWNTDISKALVDPMSDVYVGSIGKDVYLWPDFGASLDNGIPFQYVTDEVNKVSIEFDYPEESDLGLYPMPSYPLIEVNSDRHMLVVNTDQCILYELYKTRKESGQWYAGSGAIWDLNQASFNPECRTSADAAGLPIYAGLVRYEEVMSGEINHALRFTAKYTQRAFVPPATHYASSDTNPALPPMGIRLRLRDDFNIDNAPPQSKVVLTALKKYGMLLADNGKNWYLTGEANANWDEDDLDYLTNVPGEAFEVLKIESITKECQ